MKVDALKIKIQEVLEVQDLFLSYKKNPEGSDLSFIYNCISKENSQNVNEILLGLNWFDKIEFKGPYINLWLKKSMLALGKNFSDKKKVENSRRIFQLNHRLKVECKDFESLIDAYWYPLLKAYNLCVIDRDVLGHVSQESIEKMMETFKTLDLGYMYRGQSKNVLKGISDLLEGCTKLLERRDYE